MKKSGNPPETINSISDLHRKMSLPRPGHPLVSLIELQDIQVAGEDWNNVVLNYYNICLKKNIQGKMKYGQHYYDFDEGLLSFISPGQVVSVKEGDCEGTGLLLIFHPDLIRNYPLGKQIRNYGFFSYAVHEALHLSEREEATMITGMKNIRQEYSSPIDTYSQDILVSQIELLLNYANRFYNRQFITRKTASHDLLARLEELLLAYFNTGTLQNSGLPSVKYISDTLNVSPNYLSDVLRSVTGQSTQQHIHNRLIEKAKEILATTSLSIGEIAYQLGFEHPQSFSKLFKSKTNTSPVQFRHSFN